ncbi:ATP-dependent DNA helicase RecG [Brevinematales bacterium NS]|nr:ATP-dependent DNA helicase RecG [Brevinematales bacterium NS]
MYLADLRSLSIENLPFLTPKQKKALKKIGLETVYDILTYFPFRYEDRKEISSIETSLLTKKPVTTIVRVIDHESIFFQNKKHPKIIVQDNKMRAALVGFHRPYLFKNLRIGNTYWLYAQFFMKYNEIQATSFEFEPYEEKAIPKHFGKILPVYRLPSELYPKEFQGIMQKLLDTYLSRIEDEIPVYAVTGHKLLSKTEAYQEIHFPTDFSRLRKARIRIAYEEVFGIQIAVQLRRKALSSFAKDGRYLSASRAWKMLSTLPFPLTTDQQKTMKEIEEDLFSSQPMHRLLQGDVGAGKTLVAFFAMLVAAENNHQTALLVPTESLAFQHYHSLKNLVKEAFFVALLTSSTPPKDRKDILEKLQTKEPCLVVGTHALLQPDVVFSDLALVVFDEQHKFGVEQRLALSKKGNHPDLLVMTATPIPRTISLTLYGDLDISIIREKPQNRLPIKTHWITTSEYSKMLAFIKKELENGRQAFFVYPVIEASEKLELKSLEHYHRQIQEKLSPFEVVWLHGRMSSEEKTEALDRFRSQKAHVLVSTLVIEVGIDVPNATVMVIEAADRFGLSQLHQLRGRVGRGSHQSYCFLVTEEEISEEAKERMKILCETDDGFAIAEADFKQRGPGEILGVRQSGLPELKVADLCDHRFVAMCMEDTRRIIAYDPELALPKHRCIVEGILKFLPLDYLRSG